MNAWRDYLVTVLGAHGELHVEVHVGDVQHGLGTLLPRDFPYYLPEEAHEWAKICNYAIACVKVARLARFPRQVATMDYQFP